MSLDQTDVAKQIEHMIAFIRQEATERAQEIEAKAEEEFNIEKSRLISEQRAKITEYYEKKEKQLELQRKIQRSHVANASRLSILQARDDCVQRLKDEAKKKLAFSIEDRSKYIILLLNLITQGLFVLRESKVVVRCRHEDYGLAQRLIRDAVRRYEDELKQKDTQVIVDNENFLADDLAGGVELYAMDGKIKVSNTIETRLEIIFDQMLPEIREKLFAGNHSRTDYEILRSSTK